MANALTFRTTGLTLIADGPLRTDIVAGAAVVRIVQGINAHASAAPFAVERGTDFPASATMTVVSRGISTLAITQRLTTRAETLRANADGPCRTDVPTLQTVVGIRVDIDTGRAA
jgi:hypothetical protein